MVTSEDLLGSGEELFLRIREPKTRETRTFCSTCAGERPIFRVGIHRRRAATFATYATLCNVVRRLAEHVSTPMGRAAESFAGGSLAPFDAWLSSGRGRGTRLPPRGAFEPGAVADAPEASGHVGLLLARGGGAFSTACTGDFSSSQGQEFFRFSSVRFGRLASARLTAGRVDKWWWRKA